MQGHLQHSKDINCPGCSDSLTPVLNRSEQAESVDWEPAQKDTEKV